MFPLILNENPPKCSFTDTEHLKSAFNTLKSELDHIYVESEDNPSQILT